MTAGTKRRVRVVIEGEAREVSGRCGILRVDLAPDETGLPATVMVNPSWDGVTVEDLAPSYNWQDGDVVQDPEDEEAFSRTMGRWLGTGNPGRLTDGHISGHVVSDGWRVLRYQAGEA